MLRKTTCAVAGVALACATAFSLSLVAQSAALTNLDLRWFHAAKKGDRLMLRAPADQSPVMLFDLSSQSMTIVTRVRAHPTIESAVHTPRPTSVRTIPMQPVRELPKDHEVKREKLPTGCEPAFSPVTNPDFAHIGVRCDS